MRTHSYRDSETQFDLACPRFSLRTMLTAGRLAAFVVLLIAFGSGNSLALDHSGGIAGNETWLAADNPHNVVGVVTVNAGVTLTIQAGAEVYLGSGKRIDILGTLTAVGAPGQEILFTKSDTNIWSYLRFLTNGDGTLAHCTIENANYGIYNQGDGNISVSDCLLQDNNRGVDAAGGTIELASTTFNSNSAYGFYGRGVAPNLLDANVVFTNNGTGLRLEDVTGLNLTTPLTVSDNTNIGIHLQDCVGATIDNQVVTGNVGSDGGFFLDNCGDFTLGGGNAIGGSGLENSWPVTISIGSYPSAGSVIPTTGNTNNDIQVSGGASSLTGTWRKFAGVDYVVTATGTIAAGGELIIDPAVTVRLGSGKRLDILGSLTAVGAPGQEILFTKSGANIWSYLRFLTNGGGTLAHCTIENANYGINNQGNGNISVSDCLLQNNNRGVDAAGGTVTFLRSQIINNIQYGVYLHGGTPVFGNSGAEWNDIYGNGTGQPGRDLHNGVTDITAGYVYWGTIDPSEILENTWDERDDVSLGLIYYRPLLDAAHEVGVVAVDDGVPGQAIPARFGLHQNAPNPFNPSTVIRFDLPAAAAVRLKIFDVSGALVATPLDGQLPAGYHEVAWSGTDDQGRSVPSGVYFYQVATGAEFATRRMMLLK